MGLLVALQPLGALGQAAPPLFQHVGDLDRYADDAREALGADFVPRYEQTIPIGSLKFGQGQFAGTAIVIPQTRQMFQFYPAPLDGPIVKLLVRDLDTMKISRTLQINSRLQRESASAGGGGWTHAIDPDGKRLFLVDQNQERIWDINLQTFSVTARALLGRLSFGHGIGGITYDRFDDSVLVLYSGPGSSSVANMDVFVYRVELTNPPQPSSLTNVFRINSCTGPVMSTDVGSDSQQWEILTTERYLYVPCSRAGHIGTVVRLTRPSPQNRVPREDYVAGPVYAESVLADQDGGRLVMITIAGEVWIFEAETMSFIGVVAGAPEGSSNPTSGWGLDSETGRFFFQSQAYGLGVVEGRFFPVPQARRIPRLAHGQERIVIDSSTRRVFVLEGYYVDINGKAPAYRIYRTDQAPIPPPPPDPDRSTADVEENPEVTESRFFSSGGGYGARIIWAKGWGAVIPAPVLGQQAPTTGIGNATQSRGGFVDREFSVGRVYRAEYDTGSTSASAIAAGVDEYSRQEFNWSRNAAVCSSSEGGQDEKGAGKPDDLGPSTVVCPVAGGKLRAFAQSRLPAIGSLPAEWQGNVTVGKAWTETVIQKLNRGVLSESVSVAQDIEIGGVIHIGEVRSKATSLATGRPSRKDMSTHSVAIRGVRIGEDLLCSECADTEAVVDALNIAGGPLRAQFRSGTHENIGIDLALKRGTPKGAMTGVQKSEARRTQDRVLVADNTTEVPGLEMVTYNDNIVYGRARQIYQFAGVSTVANYNIVPLPKAQAFADDSSLPIVGDLPGEDAQLLLQEGSSAESSDDGGLLGAIRRAVEAIERGLRMFLSNPRQFLLLLTAWALFGLAPYLARRRRLLDLARTA